MKFLRTASTRRLLATIAGAVVIIAAGTAIAVAAAGNGPVPPKRSLAQAVHTALNGPAPQGIFARIQFTNHLIDASDLQGSDPILTGANGRLWISNNQLRLELQGTNGDAQVIVSNGSFWVYDPTSNTIYKGELPPEKSSGSSSGQTGQEAIPSIAQIQSTITRLLQHVDLSGAIPGDVAGQAAYTVRISPQHSGGLLGAAELAWDAARGIPLRVAIYARGGGSPVLELKATSISYRPIKPQTFQIPPISGAKVVELSAPAGGLANHGRAAGKHAAISGVTAVAAHVPFRLVAPKTIVGLKRQSVTLMNWKGSPAALVTYGENVGGIAVIEESAANGAPASNGSRQTLNLPTVSINGATAHELATALGTIITFNRAGVGYTVLGSVPPIAAERAAGAL
jgi:outer membrane lipoprotein-sorting protein